MLHDEGEGKRRVELVCSKTSSDLVVKTDAEDLTVVVMFLCKYSEVSTVKRQYLDLSRRDTRRLTPTNQATSEHGKHPARMTVSASRIRMAEFVGISYYRLHPRGATPILFDC